MTPTYNVQTEVIQASPYGCGSAIFVPKLIQDSLSDSLSIPDDDAGPWLHPTPLHVQNHCGAMLVNDEKGSLSNTTEKKQF